MHIEYGGWKMSAGPSLFMNREEEEREGPLLPTLFTPELMRH